MFSYMNRRRWNEKYLGQVKSVFASEFLVMIENLTQAENVFYYTAFIYRNNFWFRIYSFPLQGLKNVLSSSISKYGVRDDASLPLGEPV